MGSFYATWFTGGVLMMNEAGDYADVGVALIPLADLAIKDTWFVAGMKGTASNTVVAAEVFVPSERITPLSETTADAAEGDPADFWPLGSVLSLILLGPLLGAASACAELVTEKAPTAPSATPATQPPPSRWSRSPTWRTLGSTSTPPGCTRSRPLPTSTVSAPANPGICPRRLDCAGSAAARGTAMLRQGIDSLLTVGGAGSFASASVLQRHWQRDVNVGSRHTFLDDRVAWRPTAAACSASIPSSSSSDRLGPGPMTHAHHGGGAIDVHARFVPETYRATAVAAGQTDVDGFGPLPEWSVKRHLAADGPCRHRNIDALDLDAGRALR